MPTIDPIAALSLTHEAALLRVASRPLARAHPDDAATDLTNLERRATTLAAAIRGERESHLADTLDRLVADLSEDTPPAD